MIHLPASVHVYLCLTACDMRKVYEEFQPDRFERRGLNRQLRAIAREVQP